MDHISITFYGILQTFNWIAIPGKGILTSWESIIISCCVVFITNDDGIVGFEGIIISCQEVKTSLEGITWPWEDGIAWAKQVIKVTIDDIVITEEDGIILSDDCIAVTLLNGVFITGEGIVVAED